LLKGCAGAAGAGLEAGPAAVCAGVVRHASARITAAAMTATPTSDAATTTTFDFE
jgi:hypothetical protein